jgi:dTDP-4-amino-4,6-dideoxygalactose transaminase
MFFLVMAEPDDRDDLIAHLGARDILAVFHYIPLHSSPMGRRFGGRPGDCPVAEWVSDRIVRLPLFTDLTIEEQDGVIEGVLSFQPRT